MGLFDYLRDTRAELRHVSWPTRQQTINNTILVVAISIVVALFLGALDYGFGDVLKRLLGI